jgi:hypothetical protein
MTLARLMTGPYAAAPCATAASSPITEIGFCAWVAQAAPGEALEYHRGFLGIDTGPVISTLPEPGRLRLAALASAAHRAFEAGLVHLVQLRLGPDCFAYLAIARRRSRHAPAALARLVAEPEAA